MTFGWQGFELEHSDDWSPVALVGKRAEGYAGISSPGRLACQVRWKRTRSGGDLSSSVEAYLERLARDARRSKASFSRTIEREGEALLYSARGAQSARGAVFRSPACGRTFCLEVLGGRGDSLQAHFRRLLASFRASSAEEPETWAMYGLRARLPAGLSVGRKLLQAGRTRLELHGPGAQIVLERWGFGEELARRHGVEAWARALLRLERAAVERDGERLRLRRAGRFGGFAEALVDPQWISNQIVVVEAHARSERWRPKWDWLD